MKYSIRLNIMNLLKAIKVLLYETEWIKARELKSTRNYVVLDAVIVVVGDQAHGVLYYKIGRRYHS